MSDQTQYSHLVASLGIISQTFDERGKDVMEIKVGTHCCKHGLGGKNNLKKSQKRTSEKRSDSHQPKLFTSENYDKMLHLRFIVRLPLARSIFCLFVVHILCLTNGNAKIGCM